MKTKFLVPTLILFFIHSITSAQMFSSLSNPTVNFSLSHPPILGIKVNKVSFNTRGNCVDQVIGRVISNFVENDVEVIDRKNLDAILSEHKLSLSGYVDKSTAASIGKIIGPSALISLNISRCETIVKDNLYELRKKYDSKTKQNYTVKAYISRTQVMLKATIQVTDLTTGRIFKSHTFDYDEKKENESYAGRVEAPSSYEVQELVFNALAKDINKLFFHWSEKISMIYYNDKTCNLRSASELLKKSDFNGAYEQSIKNLDYCKGANEKVKFLAHAYYNLGMSQFIAGEYDQALVNLKEAQNVKDNSVIKNAIFNTQKAKNLELMSTLFEERAEFDQTASAQDASSQQSSILKNNDVITLSKSGLPESLILQKIATSDCQFDTSTESLLSLIKAGVSEKVVGAMMEK